MEITEKDKEKYKPFPTHSKTPLMPLLAFFILFLEKSQSFFPFKLNQWQVKQHNIYQVASLEFLII